MSYARWIRLAVVGVSAISLAACHGYKPLAPNQSGSADANDQAQTYGMQDGENYEGNGKKGADGRFVNPLTAPANQVYYFDFDGATVYQSDMKAISIQANYLASHPSATVRLEGNTDNRGSREYNIGLGWRRDQAIARILEQQGVLPKQIHMVSYGKEKPVALENNESAWRLNRRVKLVYEGY